MRSLAPVALLSLLGLVSPAPGSNPLPEWDRQLHEAIADLEAEKWNRADAVLDHLLNEYVKEAGEGEGNEKNLGTILVYRAIAEQALGRVEDARWDCDVAANFLPDLAHLDFAHFGEPGRALGDYARGWHPAGPFSKQEEPEGSARWGDSRHPIYLPTPGKKLDHEVRGELVRPKLVKRVKPKYTYGARVFQSEGVVIVRVVIDDEGGVGDPIVLRKQENPALTYVALAAIRKWKFRPATLDGHPINVFYNLTVNYRLKR